MHELTLLEEGPQVSRPITASMLYDLIQCPHRVSMDLFGDPKQRNAITPFVQLLWERGQEYEQEVIAKLALPFTNLRPYPAHERTRLTLEAMARAK